MSFRIAVFITILSASSTFAAVEVDQQYLAPLSVTSSLDHADEFMAQTFTIHNTGSIASIGVQVDIFGNSSPPQSRDGITDGLHVQLTHLTTTGEPDVSRVLATWVIDPLNIPFQSDAVSITSTDLSAYHLHVDAGDQLAIVINTSYLDTTHQEDRNYGWLLAPTRDPVPGGVFYVYSPRLTPNWIYSRSNVDPTLTTDGGFQVLVNTVPEPSSVVLMLIGAAIGCSRVRREPLSDQHSLS